MIRHTITGTSTTSTLSGYSFGQAGSQIQRVHNKYHETAPKDAVDIMRGSPYGNPFKIGANNMTREDCIAAFKRSILPSLDLTPLIGKHLVCCCKPKDCHGDVIIEAVRMLEASSGVWRG
jgi:hypothetical protein